MNSKGEDPAVLIAEDILRVIYGDDFKGCTVSLEQIAEVAQQRIRQHYGPAEELVELYEKVVEALHLLSTPPQGDNLTDQAQLNSLLSERLDAIHVLTTKTMETTASVKKKQAEGR